MRYALALAIFLAAAPSRAQATSEQIDAARHAFDRALALEDAKKFEDALRVFREVLAVKATPQVRFHVAYCLHKLGKLVDAGRELDQAREDAQALGPAGAPLVDRAMQERTDLYASTPRISVKLADGTRPPSAIIDGASVTLGDDPIAVDPGSHHVVVERSGKPPFERDVVVAERRPAVVAEIVVVDPTIHISPAVIAFGGLTIASFGAAIVTGVFQSQLASKLDSLCGADHHQCPATAQNDIDTAKTLTVTADVLFGVSAASLVATTVLFFFTYKSHPQARITSGHTNFGTGLTFRF